MHNSFAKVKMLCKQEIKIQVSKMTRKEFLKQFNDFLITLQKKYDEWMRCKKLKKNSCKNKKMTQ